MTIPYYEVFVRDRNFKKTQALKFYSKLELHLRFQDAGSWTMTMPNDGNIDVQAMYDAYFNGAGFGGIVVVRGGTIIFSGPIRGFEADGDFTSIQDQETITFFGIDDTGLLASRICMVPDPNPTSGGMPNPAFGEFVAPYGANADTYLTPYTQPPTQGWGYWVYPSGDQSNPLNRRSVSQVMFTTISNNIGPTAPYNIAGFAQRRIPNLIMGSNVVFGPSYQVRARYENLLTTIKEAAMFIPDTPFNYTSGKGAYDGLGFQIQQVDALDGNGNGVIKYSVYEPNNLTNSVIFSKGFKNLASYRYSNKAPDGNYVVCGGMNNTPVNRSMAPLTKYTFDVRRRWFFHAGGITQNPVTGQTISSVNQYGLWEYFLDRRDVQYPLPDATGALVNDPIGPPTGRANWNATYLAMLQEVTYSMRESLVDMTNLIDVDIETLDVAPTRAFTDFNLGDKVSVIITGPNTTYQGKQVPGFLVQDRIRDIFVTLSYQESEKITCRIGTQVAGLELNLFKKMKKTNRRIGHLDSSY